jgi:hypothetical protein
MPAPAESSSGVRLRWHATALTILIAAGLWSQRGWLAPDLLPGDDVAGYAAVMQDTRDTILRHGHLPHWSPKWFGGTTRLASSLKELLSLPLAIWLGPLRAVLAMTILLKVVAGLLAYAIFARYFRAPAVGIVAGYAYAFCVAASYQIHLDVALSFALLPLVLIATVETFARRSVVAALGLGLAVACQLSNNVVQAILCPVLVALLLVLRPWSPAPGRDDPLGDRRLALRWAALAGAALLAFSGFAASQLAWYASDRHNHMLHRPEVVAIESTRHIRHSPFSFVNRANWLGPWLETHHPPGMTLFRRDPLTNQRLYLGAVALAVATAGWFLCRRDRSLRRWFQLFALLFLVQYGLSTGTRSLTWLLARSFHWPGELERALVLAGRVAALACVAWAALLALRSRRPVGARRMARIELLGGLAMLGWLATHSLFDLTSHALPLLRGMRSPGHFFDVAPLSIAGAFGVGLVALERSMARRGARLACIAAVFVLVAIDQGPGSASFARGSSLEPVRQLRETAAALRVSAEPERILLHPWRRSQDWIPSSLVAVNAPANVAWGWLTWQSSEPWLLFAAAATAWLDEPPDAPGRARLRRIGDALSRLGRFRYLLYEHHGRLDLRPGEPWALVTANERFALWERPDVGPFAHGLRSCAVFAGREDLDAAFLVGRAAAGGLLVLVGDEQPSPLAPHCGPLPGPDRLGGAFPHTARPAPVPVRHSRPSPGRVLLHIDAGAQGAFVLVSEAYHPWWRATVDGKPAPVRRAQLALMAVRVGAGEHRVELRFQPPAAVRAADALTAASWGLLALGAPLVGWRHWHRRARAVEGGRAERRDR